MRKKPKTRWFGFTYGDEKDHFGKPMKDHIEFSVDPCTYNDVSGCIVDYVPILKNGKILGFIWEHELIWEDDIARKPEFNGWKIGERSLDSMLAVVPMIPNLSMVGAGHFPCMAFALKGHEQEVLNILSLMNQWYMDDDEIKRPIVEIGKRS